MSKNKKYEHKVEPSFHTTLTKIKNTNSVHIIKLTNKIYYCI